MLGVESRRPSGTCIERSSPRSANWPALRSISGYQFFIDFIGGFIGVSEVTIRAIRVRSRSRSLPRRAGRVPIRAEHAAVTRPGADARAALHAVVDVHARVDWHDFVRLRPAHRAAESRSEIHASALFLPREIQGVPLPRHALPLRGQPGSGDGRARGQAADVTAASIRRSLRSARTTWSHTSATERAK